MLESTPFILILGTVLGFLSGIGVGGGSLLILWLTIGLGMPQETARSINLLFFLPSALIASCFRWRQGKLECKNIFPAVIVGCICAGFFSYISTILNTALLQKAFGGLLLFTGFRELFYKPKNSRRHA